MFSIYAIDIVSQAHAIRITLGNVCKKVVNVNVLMNAKRPHLRVIKN